MATLTTSPTKKTVEEIDHTMRVTITLKGGSFTFPTFPSNLIMVSSDMDDVLTPEEVLEAIEEDFKISTIPGFLSFLAEIGIEECLGLVGTVEIVANE